MGDKTQDSRKLDKSTIRKILHDHKAMTVHEVTLLDYLNQISESELSEGFVIDDPMRRGKGYGLGSLVANRIISKRDNAKFTSLDDLVDIKGFGPDKFNDLIYSYTNLRLPLPSGLGKELDELLLAIAKLELIAKHEGIEGKYFLELLYSLTKSPTDEDPHAATNIHGLEVSRYSEWSERPEIFSDIEVLRRHRQVPIKKTDTHFHHLIACLVSMQAFEDIPEHSFISRIVISANYTTREDDIVTQHFKYMSLAHYHAMADALIITNRSRNETEGNAKQSFVWNLLKHYTERDYSVSKKFSEVIKFFDLPQGKEGIKPNFKAYNQWQETFATYAKHSDGSLHHIRSSARKDLHLIFDSTIHIFFDTLHGLSRTEDSEPKIITWNRLESRPKDDNFVRSLQAEVRDPLWMIA